MTAKIFKAKNIKSLEDAVLASLSQSSDTSNRILIARDLSATNDWRKRLADSPTQSAFGVKISTFMEFVKQAWVLFGDGRSLITNIERRVYVAKLIGEFEARHGNPCPVNATYGTIDMISRIVSVGAGVASFEIRALEASGVPKSTKDAIWCIIEDYFGLLGAIGAIEYGQCLVELADKMGVYEKIVVVDPYSISPVEVEFFESVGAEIYFLREKNDPAFAKVDSLMALFEGIPSEVEFTESESTQSAAIAGLKEHLYCFGEPLEKSGDIRFAFSEGRYSESAQIARLVVEHIQMGYRPSDIVVTGNDSSIALACMRRLAAFGVSSTCSFSIELVQTEFGKALKSLLSFDSKYAVSDFALSPFSGIPLELAYALDARWRSNRSIDAKGCLAELAANSKYSKRTIEALNADDYVAVSQCMLDAFIRTGQGSDLERKIASKANEKIVAVFDAAKKAKVGIDVALLVAGKLNVTYSFTAAPVDVSVSAANSESVRFETIASISSSSAKVAIISGLTSEGYPVSKDDDSSVVMLSEVGIEKACEYIDSQRYDFYRALSCVEEKVVFQRSLHDVDGDEMRQSVLLDEVSDCFRDDLMDIDSLDGKTGIPKDLNAAIIDGKPLSQTSDDGDLNAISPTPFGSDDPEGDDRQRVPIALTRIDEISDAHRANIGNACVRRRDGEPRIFSATSVDAYLNCPYRWFVERQLKPSVLDAKFDAVLSGIVIHGVLQTFYELASGNLQAPVRVDEIPQMVKEDFLGSAFEMFLDSYNSENPDNPISPTSLSDQMALMSAFNSVASVLKDDARFLSGFKPAMFEEEFGKDGETFEYAGRKFAGVIDRVDIDENGRGVVIDYKGALGDGYQERLDIGAISIPAKVQPLIYASALERLRDIEVVGSVFRSYKTIKGIAGIFDAMHVGYSQLFDASKTLIEYPHVQFREALKCAEDVVASALDRLEAGDINPSPLNSKSCKYCPEAGRCAKEVK